MPKKAVIFVDANNWYHNLKKNYKPSDIDITKISNFISNKFKMKYFIVLANEIAGEIKLL